jgi:hypothetical protein
MPRSTRKLLDVERTYGMYEFKRPLAPTRYYFGTEKKPYRYLSKREYARARELQAREAVKVHTHNGKAWWWFQRQVYVQRDDLTSQDVTALAIQMRRAKGPMRCCRFLPRQQKTPSSGAFVKRMMGLEPTTFCMASRCSSQLSYIRVALRV